MIISLTIFKVIMFTLPTFIYIFQSEKYISILITHASDLNFESIHNIQYKMVNIIYTDKFTTSMHIYQHKECFVVSQTS